MNMRTIVFYSYKGGAGRSLLLSNVGVLAARLGSSVVMLDMDFEAPGLEYKFPPLKVAQHPGVIDYLRGFTSRTREDAASLIQWLDVPAAILPGGRLGLMSAGRAPSASYFSDLAALDLDNILLGQGMEALLSLQAEIEESIGPDYLLIDSRTGITNTNKATTRALADSVVTLAVDSPEQLDGTRAVLRGLNPLTSLRSGDPVELIVVRSRSSAHKTAEEQHADPTSDLSRMLAFLNEPAKPLSSTLNISPANVVQVRSDHGIATREVVALGLPSGYHSEITGDYLEVVAAILPQLLQRQSLAILASQIPESRIGMAETLFNFWAPEIEWTQYKAETPPFEAKDRSVKRNLLRRVEEARTIFESTGDYGLELIEYLQELAEAHDSLGQYEESLAAEEEALIVSRLIRDHDAPTALLFDALMRVGITYRLLGQHHDAFANLQSAVDEARSMISRSSNDDDDPLAQMSLASALVDLSSLMNDMGDQLDALPIAEEAVTVARALEGGEDSHRELLAEALSNLAALQISLGLFQHALEIVEGWVDICRKRINVESGAGLAELARSLNAQAFLLANLGLREQGIPVARESVAMHRQLADTEPRNHLAALAASLSNLSSMLANSGEVEEALPIALEAVAIYRRVNTELYADDQSGLASALNNLGNNFAQLGREYEALEASQEALEIRRAIALQDESLSSLSDLATSLNNVGNHLSVVGMVESAVMHASEATAVTRQLALADSKRFMSKLGTSLNNLGNHFAEMDRGAEALAATAEAVRIRRDLAAENHALNSPELAGSLNNYAIRLAADGQLEEALQAAQEATTELRKLADREPSVYRPDLTAALNTWGGLLARVGDFRAALAAMEESVAMRRELAGQSPSAFDAPLASSIINRARLLAELGRLDEARVAVEEAVDLRRALSSRNPAAHLGEYATSLQVSGDILIKLGLPEDAFTVLSQSADILRGLAAQNSQGYGPRLKASLNELSELLFELGRADEADRVAAESSSIQV